MIIIINVFLSQSTYCTTVFKHCQSVKRSVHVVNLDPAAEHFDYPVEVGEHFCAILSVV